VDSRVDLTRGDDSLMKFCVLPSPERAEAQIYRDEASPALADRAKSSRRLCAFSIFLRR
jgi:hypothetical protein